MPWRVKADTAFCCREMNKMKSKKNLTALLLATLVLIPALVFIDKALSNPENPNGSKVLFYVS
jgi:hypothetical protein